MSRFQDEHCAICDKPLSAHSSCFDLDALDTLESSDDTWTSAGEKSDFIVVDYITQGLEDAERFANG